MERSSRRLRPARFRCRFGGTAGHHADFAEARAQQVRSCSRIVELARDQHRARCTVSLGGDFQQRAGVTR